MTWQPIFACFYGNFNTKSQAEVKEILASLDVIEYRGSLTSYIIMPQQSLENHTRGIESVRKILRASPNAKFLELADFLHRFRPSHPKYRKALVALGLQEGSSSSAIKSEVHHPAESSLLYDDDGDHEEPDHSHTAAPIDPDEQQVERIDSNVELIRLKKKFGLRIKANLNIFVFGKVLEDNRGHQISNRTCCELLTLSGYSIYRDKVHLNRCNVIIVRDLEQEEQHVRKMLFDHSITQQHIIIISLANFCKWQMTENENRNWTSLIELEYTRRANQQKSGGGATVHFPDESPVNVSLVKWQDETSKLAKRSFLLEMTVEASLKAFTQYREVSNNYRDQRTKVRAIMMSTSESDDHRASDFLLEYMRTHLQSCLDNAENDDLKFALKELYRRSHTAWLDSSVLTPPSACNSSLVLIDVEHTGAMFVANLGLTRTVIMTPSHFKFATEINDSKNSMCFGTSGMNKVCASSSGPIHLLNQDVDEKQVVRVIIGSKSFWSHLKIKDESDLLASAKKKTNHRTHSEHMLSLIKNSLENIRARRDIDRKDIENPVILQINVSRSASE